jgi:hypothetical protein
LSSACAEDTMSAAITSAPARTYRLAIIDSFLDYRAGHDAEASKDSLGA